MLHSGEGTSKKEALLDGSYIDKIFSYNTYKTYHQQCRHFASYIHDHHPECTTLRAAKKYVGEWLQLRADETKTIKEVDPKTREVIEKKVPRYSAWTIQTAAKALGKLYSITPEDPDFFHAPKRRRQDIKRSRVDVSTDKHFSVTNNANFIKFCKGTGCRRNVLNRLQGRDLWTKEEIEKEIIRLKYTRNIDTSEQKLLSALEDAMEHFSDQGFFIHHKLDKGGRQRFAPIIGKNTEYIIEKMRSVSPDEKVWQYVPKHADVHGY